MSKKKKSVKRLSSSFRLGQKPDAGKVSLDKLQKNAILDYGVCPTCGNHRIIQSPKGRMVEDPKTGELKFKRSGSIFTCASVEGENYKDQRRHFTIEGTNNNLAYMFIEYEEESDSEE